MTKPKLKSKSAKTIGAKPTEVKSEDAKREKAREEITELLHQATDEATDPTVEQLAHLAAAISQSPNDDPSELTDAAIELWEVADKKLRSRIMEKFQHKLLGLEYGEPECFPIMRDDFLCFVLPRFKYRTSELASAAKAYAKAKIEANAGNVREATPEEVSTYYANWKPIETLLEYQMAAREFRLWWSSHHSTNVSEIRRSVRLNAIAEAAKESTKSAPKKSLKKALTHS